MSSVDWIVLALQLLAVIALIGWSHENNRRREFFVEQFRQQFPGRCMICSYHRYGYDHGFEQSPTPPAHRCIERLAALRPRERKH